MTIQNILSFDIEGLIESSHDSMTIPKKYLDKKKEDFQIVENTNQIMKVLSDNNVKATFFILGRIAKDLPNLIRDIANEGHEIACHSLDHFRLYNFSREDVVYKITTAKKYLEDASGQRITGFRAPDFSIIQKNIYVFDELFNAGFEYDSSVYPIGMHDVYGISDFKDTPFIMENGLVELPMSTVSIFNKSIPFGGGGYFRIFPFFITKQFLKKSNSEGRPMNFYLHPYEIGKEVTHIKEIPLLRKIRTYMGVGGVENKINKLVSLGNFGRADQVVSELKN
jgi:polysaccharide deacetylase family protein (PEP-CTERM system associated)